MAHQCCVSPQLGSQPAARTRTRSSQLNLLHGNCVCALSARRKPVVRQRDAARAGRGEKQRACFCQLCAPHVSHRFVKFHSPSYKTFLHISQPLPPPPTQSFGAGPVCGIKMFHSSHETCCMASVCVHDSQLEETLCCTLSSQYNFIQYFIKQVQARPRNVN